MEKVYVVLSQSCQDLKIQIEKIAIDENLAEKIVAELKEKSKPWTYQFYIEIWDVTK